MPLTYDEATANEVFTPEAKQAMFKNGTMALPDNPSSKGITARQIKSAIAWGAAYVFDLCRQLEAMVRQGTAGAVPYTGANQDLDLGSMDAKAASLTAQGSGTGSVSMDAQGIIYEASDGRKYRLYLPKTDGTLLTDAALEDEGIANKWFVSEEAPTERSTGLPLENGDLWLDFGGNVRSYSAQGWSEPLFSLKGPQGDDGNTGPQGSPLWPAKLTSASDVSGNVTITLASGTSSSDGPKAGQYVCIAEDVVDGSRLGNVYMLENAGSPSGTSVSGQVDPASPVGNIRGPMGAADNAYTKAEADARFVKQPIYFDLSGEADYQLYQGLMAGYDWTWDSLNDVNSVTSLKSSFVLVAQSIEAEAGKSYLALFGGSDTNGLRASVFTVGSDGTSVTWDTSKRWEIPLGAQIRMPNGAVYLAVAKPTKKSMPIYDCVTPVAGKIPLTYSNKTIGIANMENVAVYLKPVDNSQEDRIIFGRGNKNLTIYLDTSEVSSYAPELRVAKDEYGGSPLCAGTPLIPSQNNFFDIGFNQRAYRPILVYNGSTSGEFSPTFQTNPFNNFNAAGSVTYLSLKKPTNTEEGDGKNVITLDDGSKRVVRYNVVWNFDEFGGMTSTPLVCFDPYEETAAASMTPAKAMALSLSTEPGMSQEEFSKIIEGKKGIFTIKDGKAYDLLTGEYVSE